MYSQDDKDRFLIETIHGLAIRELSWLSLVETANATNAIIRSLDKLGFDTRYFRVGPTFGIYFEGSKLSYWGIFKYDKDNQLVLHEAGGAEFPQLIALLVKGTTKKGIERLWLKVRGKV